MTLLVINYNSDSVVYILNKLYDIYILGEFIINYYVYNIKTIVHPVYYTDSMIFFT